MERSMTPHHQAQVNFKNTSGREMRLRQRQRRLAKALQQLPLEHRTTTEYPLFPL
jgi:hypothetical protein